MLNNLKTVTTNNVGHDGDGDGEEVEGGEGGGGEVGGVLGGEEGRPNLV